MDEPKAERRIHMRVRQTTYAQIRALAAVENRSAANMLDVLVAEALAARTATRSS